MKPTDEWIVDWRYSVDPPRERKVSEDLVAIFSAFWDWAELDSKSKTTQQVY